MSEEKKKLAASIASESIILIGMVCLSIAAWWLHPACGMAVVGLALLVIGFGSHLNKGETK